FEWLEMTTRTAYPCCPGWLKGFRGVDVASKSVAEIWNDPQFQEFRESILDGSFRFCEGRSCPFLAQPDLPHWEKGGGPVRPITEVQDERLKSIIERGATRLEDGPSAWNCTYDRSCNLSCPSCRSELISLGMKESEPLIEFQERILSEMGKGLTRLYVTGTGDPFASRVYRHLLRGIDAAQYPNLRIHLHSNGLMWTPRNWAAISHVYPLIDSAHISMDAATPASYWVNRRGGDWEKLWENLDFIASLRRS